jgi:hypothetical protein
MALGSHCRRAAIREKKLGQKLRVASTCPYTSTWSWSMKSSFSAAEKGLKTYPHRGDRRNCWSAMVARYQAISGDPFTLPAARSSDSDAGDAAIAQAHVFAAPDETTTGTRCCSDPWRYQPRDPLRRYDDRAITARHRRCDRLSEPGGRPRSARACRPGRRAAPHRRCRPRPRRPCVRARSASPRRCRPARGRR